MVDTGSGIADRDPGTDALQRQPDLEPGSAEVGVEHVDAPLVHLDELLRDRQAQARSSDRPVDAAVALPEALENRLPQLRLHARSGVVHGDGDLLRRVA